VDEDFIALSCRPIKPNKEDEQLSNNSDSKLEEISFKSSSLVLLSLICRIVRGFISVHADSVPPENVPLRLASVSRANLLSLIE
jgi:hypothetical protein